MSIPDLAGLAVKAVDALWSLYDDFAPAATLKELTSLVSEVRESLLDRTPIEQETVLKARIDALKRARAAVVMRADAGDVDDATRTATLSMLERRIRVLSGLLDTGPRVRDNLTGTLSESINPGEPSILSDSPWFIRLGDHPGTGELAATGLRKVAEDAFGSRRLRDNMTERRARTEERLKVLTEVDEALSRVLASSGVTASAQVAAASTLRNEIDAATYAARACQGTKGDGPATPSTPSAAANSSAGATSAAARTARRSIPIG